MKIRKTHIHSVPALIAVILLIAAFGAGYFRGIATSTTRQAVPSQTPEAPADKVKFYTCSMHPQVRLQDPDAKCPICFMDLIPVKEEAGDTPAGHRELRLTETAQRLADVATTPVARWFVARETRLSGKIESDETRVKRLSAWTPGRIERMFVDYTGIRVAKGDHLFTLYSPELVVAQQELLLALKTGAGAGARRGLQDAGPNLLGPTADSLREKLRLWGLTDKQIRQIEKSGEAGERVTIYSPAGGTVIEKLQKEGDYVRAGDPIYTIADLSRVWLMADAYESDLAWIRYGQDVSFEVEAWPGEIFHGRIAFIAPTLDEDTRTVRVRVNAPNPDGRLKPGMFARAVVRSRVAAEGRVMAADLEGKWICPMHPEVIKDRSDQCDICGMPLVPVEQMGYVPVEKQNRQAPLVIPASAPLVTGKRAVVYVADPDRPGVFEGREVRLGPRAGDYYIVESGLREGEKVVIQGAFKIDSSMQIAAKPSMMNPVGAGAMSGHDHAASPMKDEAHADHADAAAAPDAVAPPKGARLVKDLSADEKERLQIEEQRENYPLDTCVVSDGKLGSMGEPVEIVYNGRLIRFCCDGCIGLFEESPEAYLKKLDDAGKKE